MEGVVKCFVFMVFTFHTKNVFSTVYFSGEKEETYQNSSVYCENMGGNLLGYGELLIKTAETCSSLLVWTATPWYNRKIGCFIGVNIVKETQDGKENKHLAICADFCADSNYTSIGLWTTKCQCYGEKTIFVQSLCESTTCPANANERCAVGDAGVIYEKVNMTGALCRYRSFRKPSEGGITLKFAQCQDLKPFICKVGNTENIQCSFNKMSSSAGMSAETKGAIIGAVVAVAVLVLLILLIIIFLRYRRKSQKEMSG
ncbi:uncharacterized protein LOC127730353 [Mytilus californianus]|uniref:uncharacterized protein LOC127730353 n=1 Tax=Mytilus californianus TaxID=6549 RepID=UPI00224671C1|nr:uncharacterized protein LOC127730353 [Mytilus californianus]